MTVQEFADSLTPEQTLRLHEIAYGPVPEEFADMTDDEVLAALFD
jgi:hypothetical protein